MRAFRKKCTYCRFLFPPLLVCVLLVQQVPLKSILFPSNSNAHYCKINGSGCTCGTFCRCEFHHSKPGMKQQPMPTHSVAGCSGHNSRNTIYIFTLSKIIISFPDYFGAPLKGTIIFDAKDLSPNNPFLFTLLRPPQIG